MKSEAVNQEFLPFQAQFTDCLKLVNNKFLIDLSFFSRELINAALSPVNFTPVTFCRAFGASVKIFSEAVALYSNVGRMPLYRLMVGKRFNLLTESVG